ncbi:DUF6766 family protein [Brevundimonas sp.]|uniref:DUF6766 family protein n=1 Tax=Brevundimonas sp. TaxID=1871086 RepID=UPI002EDBAA53
MLKKYAYAWITLGFFTVSILLHWGFGWLAYVDEAKEHGQAAQLSPWLVEMGRDTFENWQSEFLQLLWQVVGLAYFLYVGSPSSKENDDRVEAKIDAILEFVGKEKGKKLIKEIDDSHLRHHGHARVHASDGTVEGGE